MSPCVSCSRSSTERVIGCGPHAHTAEQLQARPTVEEADEDWTRLKEVADAVRDGTFPITI